VACQSESATALNPETPASKEPVVQSTGEAVVKELANSSANPTDPHGAQIASAVTVRRSWQEVASSSRGIHFEQVLG
jgi:hypothetical protein